MIRQNDHRVVNKSFGVKERWSITLVPHCAMCSYQGKNGILFHLKHRLAHTLFLQKYLSFGQDKATKGAG